MPFGQTSASELPPSVWITWNVPSTDMPFGQASIPEPPAIWITRIKVSCSGYKAREEKKAKEMITFYYYYFLNKEQ